VRNGNDRHSLERIELLIHPQAHRCLLQENEAQGAQTVRIDPTYPISPVTGVITIGLAHKVIHDGLSGLSSAREALAVV